MSFGYLKNIIDKIKKLDSEVNVYKKVVLNPSLPSLAYVNWAIHLAECGYVTEAEEKLESSTLMAHQTPESYINLGVLRARERKFDEAKELYIKALNLDHNSAKAYCFLGNALTETQDYKEAEKRFADALKIDPNNTDILINWGISLVRQGKHLQARDKFQQACKFQGANLSAIYFLGLVDLELGEMKKAKEKFKMIISMVPNHFEALYYLAYIHFKVEEYEKSLSYALKSLEVFPKKIETYMLIGENYLNLKNSLECFKYYQMGENECGGHYFFLISWGISLQGFDLYPESIEKFQQAIEINDKNDLGYASVATSYFKMKDFDNAMTYLQKTLELNPENYYAMDTLGQINLEQGNYKEAIDYFTQVLKHSAKLTDNYGKIAKAYSLDGDFTKADEFYRKAIEYQPNEIKVYIDYAQFLIEQKDYAQALKRLQKASKIDEKNLDCLNLLFSVHYILAKENGSDYNMESAIKVAEKIEKDYHDEFLYGEEKRELEQKRVKGKE